MRPSAPTLRCLPPECILSRFSAFNAYPRNIPGKTFGPNWCNLDRSFAEVGWYSTIAPNGKLLVRSMVFRTASYWVSSHQTRDLECFANSSNIPWNPPTIFHPDLIATILQTSCLLFCVPLFQQYHSFLICVALTYNDSRIDLHKICQILGNCQCKWLLVSSSTLRTFVSSFPFPGKFSFYKGKIVSTELPRLVPRQRIDDCFEIHILHKELCDLLLLNHQNFRSGHDCTGASSARNPYYFRPQTDIAIPVFREMSEDVVFTRYHFCSRLQR